MNETDPLKTDLEYLKSKLDMMISELVDRIVEHPDKQDSIQRQLESVIRVSKLHKTALDAFLVYSTFKKLEDEGLINEFVEEFKSYYSGSKEYMSGVNDATYSLVRKILMDRGFKINDKNEKNS